MNRFILKNLIANKRKFFLLLVGTLVISLGLSSLAGLLNTNKGTVENVLKNSWKGQYHIVVRPKGTKGVSEENGLMSANYLSNLRGGISLNQYHAIKKMHDISVAAPIANLGFLEYVVYYKNFNPSKLDNHTVYRLKHQSTTTNGNEKFNFNYSTYFSNNPQFGYFDSNLFVEGFLTLAAIDPVEEAKLTGIDQAVKKDGESHYFSSQDKLNNDGENNYPILLSSNVVNHTLFNKNIQVEKLSLPYNNNKAMNAFFNHVQKLSHSNKSAETTDYLDTIKGTPADFQIKDSSISNEQAHNQLLNKLFSDKDKAVLIPVNYQVGPVIYQDTKSPYPKRWKHAYNINPQPANRAYGLKYINFSSYRGMKNINSLQDKNILSPQPIGIFDPHKLHLSKDPKTELPMETYRAPTAKLVLNARGHPVNPPKEVHPTINPTDFLLNPPMALTTIDAASKLLGDNPISAIRLKVKGVENFNQASEDKLKTVARAIEKQTGLLATVTLGSSPQSTLVHVPATNSTPALGWVEEPYINLGATVTLLQNAQVSFNWVMIIVLCVAIVYVLATQWIRYLTRRKEYAVLLSLGWKPATLTKMILIEGLWFGIFSFLIAAAVNVFFKYQHPDAVSWFEVIMISLLAILIYLAGSLIPALAVRRIKPYETMRSGEVSNKGHRISQSQGIMSMAYNYMANKIYRYGLSIFSMLLPTVLLAFFIFVTLRLNGVFYTSWLGQYASLQVGTGQVVAMIITLVIAALTTMELMVQNVSEREPEIALLKAIGWRNGAIRSLILLEGLMVGFITGVFSFIISFGILIALHQQVSFVNIVILIGCSIIPLIVGTISSLIPAEMATRLLPFQRLKAS